MECGQYEHAGIIERHNLQCGESGESWQVSGRSMTQDTSSGFTDC